ncbi:MAG: site-2 protease family protein [Planctomycetia bacterium]|nr:site-2 protease family protein [Planctomycetia bacterium]
MASACFAAGSWFEWIIQPSSWGVILQVALGLGFVIFVHELGHFLVAKACGVKCEKFFLGFDVGGMKLASFKWGETEYGIGALPLGGYVKMLGQDDNPAAAAEEAHRARAAMASGDLPPEPTSGPHPAWDPRSYPAQSVPERMAIISAGVIMNVIFAVLMASWALGLGVREMTCELSSVRPGGAAWRSGLRTGDHITAIGGRKDPIFTDLRNGVTLGDVAKGVEFTIHRPADDSTRTVTLRPDTDLGVPTVGVTSPFSVTLPADLADGLPGAAGKAVPPLEAGDTIRGVDGTPVKTYAELITALSRQPYKAAQLSVERRGKAGQAAEKLMVTLPPQAVRTTGLVMTAGPIKAVQDDSPAAAAGLKPGDTITAIDGEPVGDPLAVDQRLRGKAGTKVKLTLDRAGTAVDVEIEPRAVNWIEDPRWPSSPVSLSAIGAAIGVDATVAAIEVGSPAAQAGIQPGERVVRVSFIEPGKQEAAADAGLELSAKSPSWPYVASVLQQVREGTKLAIEVESLADGCGLVFEHVYEIVGAGSFFDALSRGSREAFENLSLVYRFLHKLTSNQISPRLLGGPIEIAKQAGKSAEEGFSHFLLFLTMLSANLAVVNFLPIPVLDGGHMVFLVYEWIRGKPPSEKVVAVLSYLGLALILSLMMFVFGLDLGLIPRR